jgi:hypothetical protein
MLDAVYDPATTVVLARLIVPAVVMVPPERPAPAVIAVTVPVFVELIVTAPVAPEIEIPVPATMLVTPMFETVIAPVLAVTKMPGPAVKEETPAPEPPVAEMTPAELIVIPVPTM